MELIGKIVRKEFHGVGVSEGVIESYNQSSSFFKIRYRDGGSEEVSLSEASFLAHSAASSGKEKKNDSEKGMGRKPKKRRRVSDDHAKISDTSTINDGHTSGELGLHVVLCPNSAGDTSGCSDLDGSMKWHGGLDLNLNDGLKLDVASHACLEPLQNGGVRRCIDLNLSVDAENDDKVEAGGGGCPSGELNRKERGFDLNLGFDDENLATEAEHVIQTSVRKGKSKQSTSVDTVDGIDLERACLYRELDYGGSYQLSCVDAVTVEESAEEDQLERESLNVATSDVVVEANLNCNASEAELKVGSLEAATPVSRAVSNSGSRKRKKVMNDLPSPPQTSLRRSARRSKAKASVQDDQAIGRTTHGASDMSSSTVSAISEEKPVLNLISEDKPVPPEREGVNESKILPLKVELPPASINLNLERIPVLDLFSVYSCLRSFSTFLFLSPFGLEDFVTALKSNVANSLLDFVHVAILQTLRKHMELLSVEGSEFASSCLRSLNWDLLDTVTWPIFLAEYMLFRGCQLKGDVCVDHLRLFDGQYYQQSSENKIAILQCLCDDLIEVEAVRTELLRRTTASDFGKEFNWNMNHNNLRKTRSPVDALGSASLNEDVAEDMTDWNSDECCLCRMEGNLICCDGCPAAYHSRCVGVASNLLPEGEWFCPECLNRYHSSEVQPQKLIRGAELLGVDPHGRNFMSCCGYLLVSHSGEEESLFDYYYNDEIKAVIEVLQSSKYIYGSIASAIVKHLTSDDKLNLSRSSLNSVPSSLHAFEAVSRHLQPIDNGAAANGLVSKNKAKEMLNPVASSEGSTEVLQAGGPNQTSGIGMDQTSSMSNHIDLCGGLLPSNRTGLSAVGRKKGRSRKFTEEKVVDLVLSPVQPDPTYVNCYGFARIASSIAEELNLRSSDKKSQEIVVTEESIVLSQVKAISRNSTKFCWSSFQSLCGEVQIEKCGWCYHCKYPEERKCLFNLNIASAIPESLATDLAGSQYKQNENGHLVDVICQILSMECRLQGLLLGPYLGPYDNKMFLKSALKDSDLSLVIHRVLLLESNLHPLALSSDWGRHVDSAMTVGSASHIVISSRIASKYGILRKRSTFSDLDPPTTTRSGLVMLWWRGGRVSRKLFNWKVLPRSLALQAARKGGCVKIPGLLYPDGSEYVKRSLRIAWRAAVEKSTSVEQLALRVRELYSNIRWDDIEKTHLQATLDKDSLKSIKLFKKAIVRRRSKEETGVKYLIDFGRRRLIPDVVLRHGSLLNDPTSERKRYWLQESYVPLHLLKLFEEKRIARIAGKVTKSKNMWGLGALKKPSKRNCFEYLFTRAEKADSYQCGHCKKLVLISEAVSCQYCHEFFHKRHARASSTAVASKCTFTCHRCQSGMRTNVAIKKGKVRLQRRHFKTGTKSKSGSGKVKLKRGRPNSANVQLPVETKKRGRGRPRKNASDSLPLSNKSKNVSPPLVSHQLTVDPSAPLRRSARQAKKGRRYGNSDISVGQGESQMAKSSCDKSSELTKGSMSCKGKRTSSLSSFWKNGLWLSRKPDDERTKQFKGRKLFIPSNFSGRIDEHLKCTLCGEKRYTSGLKYIACEVCRDWFHGEVFGLDSNIIDSLIGFRCHVCLKREPPLCPYADLAKGDDVAKYEREVANSLPEQVIETRDKSFSEQEVRSPDASARKVRKVSDEGSLQDSEMKTPSEVTDLEDMTMEIDLRIENGHTSTSGSHLFDAEACGNNDVILAEYCDARVVDEQAPGETPVIAPVVEETSLTVGESDALDEGGCSSSKPDVDVKDEHLT